MLSIEANAENIIIETETQPMLESNENYILNNNNNIKITPNCNLSQDLSEKSIELFWQNLTYIIDETVNQTFSQKYSFRKVKKTKHLIKNLSGSIVSGKLTGILGPNGAGKSTLMECLAGKRKYGFSGQIVVNYKG